MPARDLFKLAPLLALGLLASPAAAQAPPSGGDDMASVPGADAYSIIYYLTDENGDRTIAMGTQHINQFVNKARCECGHEIQTQVRLKSTNGMSFDTTKQVQTFVGTMCGTAETNPLGGQFRKCIQLAAQSVQQYVQGVIANFHPIWLSNGIDTNASDDRSPAGAVAFSDCNAPVAGESGVWMCALTNGQSGCQMDEFFITGSQNSNLAKGMTGGIKYDFQPPLQAPTALYANAGDEAVVVSWDIIAAGDINGFRVLCEEVDTGMPPPGKGMERPALNEIPTGTKYFTKDNLCPDGPFTKLRTSASNSTSTTTTTTDDSSTDGEDTASDTGVDSLDATETGSVGACNDGVLDPGEECDLGMDGNSDDGPCSTNCIRQYCGDGVILAATEECDDGNLDNHDACTNTCKLAVCGDGIIDNTTETCDLGPLNGDVHALCDADCQVVFSMCGNGNKEPGEACDELSMECTSCKLDSCGTDPMLNAGEECDGGMNCTAFCTISVCGDGIVTPPEMCDDGADNSDSRECTSDCQLSRCGDGKILTDIDNQAIREECDDGDQNGDSKACLPDCKLSTCGDGQIGPNEGCDDGMGNNTNTSACRADCQPNICGDGFVGPQEECDAGNGNAEDGLCKTDCTFQGSDGLRALDWDYVCSNHLPANTTSIRITGLENDKKYNFLLVSYDPFGNPRAFEKIVAAAPVNTRDLWEQCKYQGDVCGESGFCNVAGDSDPLLGLGGLFGLGLGLVGIRRRRSRQRIAA